MTFGKVITGVFVPRRIQRELETLRRELADLRTELKSYKDFAQIGYDMIRLIRERRSQTLITEGAVDGLKALLTEFDELRARKELHAIPIGGFELPDAGGDA